MCVLKQGAPRSLEPAQFWGMYQEYTQGHTQQREVRNYDAARKPGWQTKLPGGRSKDGDRDTVSGDRILERTVSVPGDFSFSEDLGLPQVLSSSLEAQFRVLNFLIDSCSGCTKSNKFEHEN